MKKQINFTIKAHLIRSVFYLLVLCGVVALSSAINPTNQPLKFPAPQNNTAFGVNGHESAASVAAPPITILDQNGQPAVNGVPSATNTIVDVQVGPGLSFSPSTVNIGVGDTVRWTWAGSGHSVTSGPPCQSNSQFCSPDNMNCGAGILSNTGTVYTHIFAVPGSYSYFCFAPRAFGMTGVVNVSGCAPPPPNMVGWWPGDGNPNDISGDNYNGTLSGGVTFTAGEVNQAFTFNGTDGEVILPPSNAAPLLNCGPTDSFTVDAWVKPDPSVLGTNRVAVSLTYACTPEAILLVVLPDGRIDFSIR